MDKFNNLKPNLGSKIFKNKIIDLPPSHVLLPAPRSMNDLCVAKRSSGMGKGPETHGKLTRTLDPSGD
jgi:hypothetical protein